VSAVLQQVVSAAHCVNIGLNMSVSVTQDIEPVSIIDRARLWSLPLKSQGQHCRTMLTSLPYAGFAASTPQAAGLEHQHTHMNTVHMSQVLTLYTATLQRVTLIARAQRCQR
jgi:hypothetical protein